MNFLDMVTSVQVEVARPSEKTGSFVLFSDGTINNSMSRSLRSAA
ncbi:hypothetical protein [Streptomyces flaveolus]